MASVHVEDVWSTYVSMECELEDFSYKTQVDFLHEVDRLFSTFIPYSEVSKLRRNEISIVNSHSWVQEVWQDCLAVKDLTDGAFDPWAVVGGFDPSGYVKGWAADQIADQLIDSGAKHVQVNAGGDISLRGGKNLDSPWKIGIAHPNLEAEISKIYSIHSGAIATSGTVERGNHIVDPHSKSFAIGARSATVVGPNAGIADALATALIVAGRDGATWFEKDELHLYSCWVVDCHVDKTWEILRG